MQHWASPSLTLLTPGSPSPLPAADIPTVAPFSLSQKGSKRIEHCGLTASSTGGECSGTPTKPSIPEMAIPREGKCRYAEAQAFAEGDGCRIIGPLE
jgi:hypothetical protein